MSDAEIQITYMYLLHSFTNSIGTKVNSQKNAVSFCGTVTRLYESSFLHSRVLGRASDGVRRDYVVLDGFSAFRFQSYFHILGDVFPVNSSGRFTVPKLLISDLW